MNCLVGPRASGQGKPSSAEAWEGRGAGRQAGCGLGPPHSPLGHQGLYWDTPDKVASRQQVSSHARCNATSPPLASPPLPSNNTFTETRDNRSTTAVQYRNFERFLGSSCQALRHHEKRLWQQLSGITCGHLGRPCHSSVVAIRYDITCTGTAKVMIIMYAGIGAAAIPPKEEASVDDCNKHVTLTENSEEKTPQKLTKRKLRGKSVSVTCLLWT